MVLILNSHFSNDDLLDGKSQDTHVEEQAINGKSKLRQNGGHEQVELFELRDVFCQQSVFYPLLIALALMFLFQFSGQGAITFYTALIFREAQCPLTPNDCALIIGVTYFVSSILGLILKKHFGRRALLLISEIGMALSQITLGVYFYMLNSSNLILKTHVKDVTLTTTSTTSAVNSTSYAPFGTQDGYSTSSSNKEYDWLTWIPIPTLIIFTIAFNIGMGSLAWIVAAEISPVRSRKFTLTVANMTSNFWWFLVTKTFKNLYVDFGPHVPFFLYGSICILGFFFIYIFLPETQNLTAEGRDEAFRGIEPIIRRVTAGFMGNSSSRGSNIQRATSLQCLEQQPLTDNSPSPSNTTPLKQQNHVSRSSMSSKTSETVHAMYPMRPLRKPSSSSPNLQHVHPSQHKNFSSISSNDSPSTNGNNKNIEYPNETRDINCTKITASDIVNYS